MLMGSNLLKIIEKQAPTRINFSPAEIKRRNFWDFFHMQYQKILEQRRVQNMENISPISKPSTNDRDGKKDAEDESLNFF